MTDPLDVVATAEAAKRQAQRERQRIEVEKSELRRVLSSDFGRSVIMGIVERAGVFRVSFQSDRSEDTHLVAFREGCRNEGVRLFDLIQRSCPELWDTMLNERADRLAREAQEDNQ